MATELKTDHEIYRDGWHMLKAYGADAKSEALRLATDCEEQGDKTKAEQWKKVAAAIGDIAKSIPSLPTH